jgi:hypothetical protein
VAQRRPLASNLGACVARRVLSGETPGYVYWEQPDEAWDSGWRLFVGDETQADADEPTNFQINALETLLAEHPALASLFVEGERGRWDWDPQLQSYRPAP